MARLDATPDAVERIRAVGDTFAALDVELEGLADVRLRAVAQLRGEGWTYARLSEATGLSEARIAQLSRQAQAGGRAGSKN